MIEFLTLFVGLFSGPQTIELLIVEPVAAVEIRLDGRVAGTLTHKPWKIEIDFGPELAPHRLEAVARDSTGRELGRLDHWLNVGADEAEAIPGGAGPSHRHRVRSAERGGTSVAIVLEPGTTLPPLGAMQSWFASVAGEPLEVLAVEKGDAELRVVRDPAAQAFLDTLRRLVMKEVTEETPAGRESALRGAFPLGAETRLQFLSPRAAPQSRVARATNLFGTTPSYPVRQGVLRFLDHLGETDLALRLADAVAIAGRELHATGRRRAVVLLVHGASADQSTYFPSQVRAYLARLQVPVFVWAVESDAPLEAWGRGIFLSPAAFAAAVAELREYLKRQRIVTLAGRHRPQDVRLLVESGIRLAHERPVPAPIAAPGETAAIARGGRLR